MTIYDLLFIMPNMSKEIVLTNDARLEEEGYTPIRGEVDDLIENLPGWIDYVEATDIFTEDDGTLHICYYEEDTVDF